MEYFRCVKHGCDTAPLLSELTSFCPELQGRADATTRVRTLVLRGMVKSAQGGRARRDVHESRWTSGSRQLPRFQEFLKQVAAEEDGILGRARIVVLSAGHAPAPRAHQGEYFKLRNRYRFILESASGSWLTSGNQDIMANTGELWWFDNKVVNAARNEGARDSLHLIFDLLPRQLETQVMRESRRARKASLEA